MAASFLKKLALISLAATLLAATDKPVSLADALSHLQAYRTAADFRATGRLVQIDGPQRQTYQFSMRAKTIAGVFKLFCEITDPAPSRVRLLLESFPDGHTTIRTGHSGDHSPSEVSPDRWGDGLLNTNFAFEDLTESQFVWKNQSLLEETTFGTRPSIVIKSLPGSARSNYSSVTTWLDKQIFYPLKEEKVVKSSGIVKEYIFYGLRQSQGIWSASQIECKTKGKAGSTLLIISRGTEKAHLDESAFNPALLIK